MSSSVCCRHDWAAVLLPNFLRVVVVVYIDCRRAANARSLPGWLQPLVVPFAAKPWADLASKTLAEVLDDITQVGEGCGRWFACNGDVESKRSRLHVEQLHEREMPRGAAQANAFLIWLERRTARTCMDITCETDFDSKHQGYSCQYRQCAEQRRLTFDAAAMPPLSDVSRRPAERVNLDTRGSMLPGSALQFSNVMHYQPGPAAWPWLLGQHDSLKLSKQAPIARLIPGKPHICACVVNRDCAASCATAPYRTKSCRQCWVAHGPMLV